MMPLADPPDRSLDASENENENLYHKCPLCFALLVKMDMEIKQHLMVLFIKILFTKSLIMSINAAQSLE